MLQTRSTRLALLTVLSATTLLYLGITLGLITPPSSSLDLGIPWHRLPASLGFGLKMDYVDGVAYVQDLGRTGRHPIEEMMERGQRKAQELEWKKQSVGSLEEAVGDYRAAYGMDPPEGFDQWYDLAIRLHAPAVPSLYPLAHDRVLPFLSLPAPLLRRRVVEVLEQRGVLALEYRPEAAPEKRIVNSHLDDISKRSVLRQEWIDLSIGDMAFFPLSQQIDEPMILAVWVDDVSHHPPSGKVLSRSRELARAGKVWDGEELIALETEQETKKGWGNACRRPVDRDVAQNVLLTVQGASDEHASFIDDPMLYADPCIHPEHLRQVRLLRVIQQHNECTGGPRSLASHISKLRGGEMIGPAAFGKHILAPYMPWSVKREPRLWFRGNANSAFIYEGWDWREGQRFRLSEMASGRKEKTAAVEGALDAEGRVKYPVLVERGERLRRESVERNLLRTAYLNVSLVDAETAWPCGAFYAPFFFCDNPGGIRRPNCPMPLAECRKTLADEYEFTKMASDKTYELQHKFRLDVDGFGWTTRWREELSKNNVVIKVTLYPEWWAPQAIPWYHYIPGRYDFSDLYDIMSFFTGTPEERTGEISPKRQAVLDKRDKMAEEIAARGREFAVNSLGAEDMRVYMFLLLLEYRRAWSDDRVAATFKMA